VFYEIYPRSFADSDNNGVGDLNGISSKMVICATLASTPFGSLPAIPRPRSISATIFPITKISISCMERSPISITWWPTVEARRPHHYGFRAQPYFRQASVVFGFEIFAHVSHRDWYIWRDGKGPGQPPNNWISLFGGSAWKFDPTTNQYYYHFFYAQQPDLNWRNPAVETAMLGTMSWWYQRGVAGFRLDAVDTLFEDPALHDNPVLPGKNAQGDPNMENKNNTNFPEVHTELQKMRKVADESGAVLIGETWTSTAAELDAITAGTATNFRCLWISCS